MRQYLRYHSPIFEVRHKPMSMQAYMQLNMQFNKYKRYTLKVTENLKSCFHGIPLAKNDL